MIKTLYKTFQHWSEGGSVWIISDPHFEDLDCKLMNPNWIEPEEHVKRINKNVHKNDTLVCLGDVGNPEWFAKIKARKKILITGNHDKGNSIYEPYFREIYNGPLFISEKLLLSHEPIHGLEEICFNIHGHVHNGEPFRFRSYTEEDANRAHGFINLDGIPTHMNLASDVVDYYPINLGEYIRKGILSYVKGIHGITIEEAVERKESKEKKEGLV